MRRLIPDVVPLTPTAYEAWRRCHRHFLSSHLLGVPASDAPVASDRGLLVHELLRVVHERGTCRDGALVADVLAAHGADDELTTRMMERHRDRCPTVSERAAHEVDVARFHRLPPPMFMVTARIDAVWIHDGLLDARDYKTGGRWHDRVADIPGARVQAFALARYAERRGLRLRLRYEYLQPGIDDDPDPFEPDDDDLAAIEEELRAAAESMWGEQEWRGVAEREVCGTCAYRSICPDSATPGVPAWPALALAPDGPLDPPR